LRQTAEQSGGGWDAQSEKGKGTTVTAWFDTGNVDTPPVGDLPGLFRSVLMFDGPDDVVIHRLRRLDGEGRGRTPLDYLLRRSEIEEALGGLEDSGSLMLLDQYLRSLEEEDE